MTNPSKVQSRSPHLRPKQWRLRKAKSKKCIMMTYHARWASKHLPDTILRYVTTRYRLTPISNNGVLERVRGEWKNLGRIVSGAQIRRREREDIVRARRHRESAHTRNARVRARQHMRVISRRTLRTLTKRALALFTRSAIPIQSESNFSIRVVSTHLSTPTHLLILHCDRLSSISIVSGSHYSGICRTPIRHRFLIH